MRKKRAPPASDQRPSRAAKKNVGFVEKRQIAIIKNSLKRYCQYICSHRNKCSKISNKISTVPNGKQIKHSDWIRPGAQLLCCDFFLCLIFVIVEFAVDATTSAHNCNKPRIKTNENVTKKKKNWWEAQNDTHAHTLAHTTNHFKLKQTMTR